MAIADQSDHLNTRVEKIRQLENQVIELKRNLILESAVGVDEHTIEDPSFLLLRSGKHCFAAPLQYVEEVVEMPQIRPLPNPVPTICGLVNYHGALLAIVDMDELAGQPSAPIRSGQVLVICQTKDRRFAIKVDEALEVVTCNRTDITVSDEVMPGIFKTSGLLKTEELGTAIIIDLIWISVGAQLGAVLANDAATPAGE